MQGSARKPVKKARSARPRRRPRKTSWTTGPHVTNFNSCSSEIGRPSRSRATQTDVSNKIIRAPGLARRLASLRTRLVFPHFGKIALPVDPAEEVRQTLNLAYTQNFLKGQIDRRGIGFSAENSHGLFKKVLIKHKICAFHVYIVPSTLTRLASRERIKTAPMAVRTPRRDPVGRGCLKLSPSRPIDLLGRFGVGHDPWPVSGRNETAGPDVLYNKLPACRTSRARGLMLAQDPRSVQKDGGRPLQKRFRHKKDLDA